MARTEASQEIQRPPRDVFEFGTRPEHCPEWAGIVVEAKHVRRPTSKRRAPHSDQQRCSGASDPEDREAGMTQTVSSDIHTAIQAVNQQFIVALAQGDAQTMASLYSEDSELLPAGRPEVRGRAAV